jgi:hypothetical protein
MGDLSDDLDMAAPVELGDDLGSEFEPADSLENLAPDMDDGKAELLQDVGETA